MAHRERLLKFSGIAVVGILAVIGLYHLNKTVAFVFIVFWFTIPCLMVIDNWFTITRWIGFEVEAGLPESD
jgi:hypothetical protein